MTTILKPGSTGSLVKTLQQFLNQKGNLPKPIDEDGNYGELTAAAVRVFQKDAGVRVDGTVGPDTAAALAERIGTRAKSFAEALGATADAPDTSKDEEHIVLTIRGKTGTLTAREFADFQRKMRESLRGLVTSARNQAAAARVLWDHFRDLNADQYIVSWCIKLLGPSLPSGSVVTDAESAVAALEDALAGSDFDRIAKALENAEVQVNKATKEMAAYQKAVLGRAENWVSALTFTKNASFEVVKAIAKFETGGKDEWLIDAAAAAVDSAATEAGKAIANSGRFDGKAFVRIAVDAAVAGGIGLVFSDKMGAKKLIASAAKKLAPLVAKGWLARIGVSTIEEFAKKWMEKSGQKLLETAFKEVGRLITKDTRPEDFAAGLAKAVASSFPLAALDVWIDRKFAKSAYEVLKTTPALAKLFDVEKDIAFEVLEKELYSSGGSKLIEAAVEAAIGAAAGNESAEAVGNEAVAHLTKMAEFKALLASAAKKAKKR